jgi:hypothetical protein
LKGGPINAAEATTKASQPMFDWRQLRRWEIGEKKLPSGSIVRYRDPTIWEEHKGKIIGVAILILAQKFLSRIF